MGALVWSLPDGESGARATGGRVRGSLKLVKVNADEAPGLSQRFEVLAIPTLILLERGKVVDTQVGAAPAAVLRKWVTEKLGLKT